MRSLLRVYRREAGAYFGSPVAYLFVGTYLAVTLFVFFWAEAFFARGIADVEPLFQWMPILLIALVAALTMRSWSEERRADTLEVLLSAPVSSLALVGGKFLAALSLVALSLALTLPLPITVEFLGPLDWGPVIGGYVATLFLAAAYVAIGLFVSSRTDNQIVSLIVTALIGGAFYVIGTDWLTALAPQPLDELMQGIGTGSRFDEITRGVLDLRDVYYYVSLVGVFLALNVYSLERLRWGGEHGEARRHPAWTVAVTLVAVNFLFANVWLQPIATARAYITADNRYSLSSATRGYLEGLQEPLIIRGYFSDKTHPLLRAQVPQMRDLLREYDIVGGDAVRVEFADPQNDQQVAKQARERFGIEPVSLRSSGRYESSVVSAYFHVLIKYGDQTKVLDFRDLIEVQRSSPTDISVALRNPEYQVTQAVRTVARKYRSGGNLLASLDEPVTFHGYISGPERLPDKLDQLRQSLDGILKDIGGDSDKLKVQFQQPMAGDGSLAKRLQREYGFRPMTSSLLSDQRFWFYMVLEQGGQTVPVQLPDQLTEKALRKAVESGFERLGGGFQSTVAVYKPKQGRMARLRGGGGYRMLMRQLRDNATVTQTRLTGGQVPTQADLLLLLGPKQLTEKQRFAVDQFLMRGGSVVVAASPMNVNVSRRTGVQVSRKKTGLESWLAQYGVDIGSSLVLDPQSGKLALPKRGAGGGVRMQTLDYPYFIDVRGQGLGDVPMLGDLRQVTLAWTSPVSVDAKKAGDLQVTKLVQSSKRASTSSSKTVMPDYQRYPDLGFKPPKERGRQTLAVMLEGRFQSAFADRESPLAAGSGGQQKAGEAPKAGNGKQPGQGGDRQAGAQKGQGGGQSGDGKKPTVTSVVERSPPGSRLVVLGSSSAVSDAALRIIRRSTGTEYGAPLQLVQNVADWSLGDPTLLAIRGGSRYSRLLRPVGDGTEAVLEAVNYALALGGLGLIFGVQRGVARRRREWFRRVLEGEEG